MECQSIPGDRVYHLGDFLFGQRSEVLAMTRKLQGHIIIIEGNHDNIGDPRNYGFSEKHKLLEIKAEWNLYYFVSLRYESME